MAVAGPHMFAVNMDSPTREVIWRATADASAYDDKKGGNRLTRAVYNDGIIYVGTEHFFGAFDAFTGAVILHQHYSSGTV